MDRQADPTTARALQRRLAVALILVLGAAGGEMVLGHQLASERSSEETALYQPLANFPNMIGEWTGEEAPPDPKLVRKIKIDDCLQRRYAHPSGQTVVLWLSYSKSSLDQYHYPTVCMQAIGWREDQSARRRFRPLPAGESPEIMRLRFDKDQRQQLVYYWYYLIGESDIDRMMRRLSRSARAFLRGRRNASLTVEVFSQTQPADQELLDRFVAQAMSTLDEWIPAGTRVCCDLGADY